MDEPSLIAGLLIAAALAGCLAPGPPAGGEAGGDGPPYVLTIDSRYVPEVPENLSGTDRVEPARLPDGTVAAYPMYLRVTVGSPYTSRENVGRAEQEARSGWSYDDACTQASNHAPRRARANECDGHPMRSRHVLPPYYPQDRDENYSVDPLGWHGRGYEYETENDSRPWNHTRGFYGAVPVDPNGSIRLVFHHEVPLPVRVTAPGGEIPEWMDEEVLRPENCTSERDEPYDYVQGDYPRLGGVEGAYDPTEGILRGDARVVMEWSAVCVRDKRRVQV